MFYTESDQSVSFVLQENEQIKLKKMINKAIFYVVKKRGITGREVAFIVEETIMTFVMQTALAIKDYDVKENESISLGAVKLVCAGKPYGFIVGTTEYIEELAEQIQDMREAGNIYEKITNGKQEPELFDKIMKNIMAPGAFEKFVDHCIDVIMGEEQETEENISAQVPLKYAKNVYFKASRPADILSLKNMTKSLEGLKINLIDCPEGIILEVEGSDKRICLLHEFFQQTDRPTGRIPFSYDILRKI